MMLKKRFQSLLLALVMIGMLVCPVQAEVPESEPLSVNSYTDIEPVKDFYFSLAPQQNETKIGEAVQASIKVHSYRNFSKFRVEIKHSDNVLIDGPLGFEIPGTEGLDVVEGAFSYIVQGKGEESITVNIDAITEDGKIVSGDKGEISILSTDEMVLQGVNGKLDLKLKDLDKKKNKGEIDDREHQKKEAELFKAGTKVVSKAEVKASLSSSEVAAAASSSITVEGNIQWTDDAGNLHAAEAVPVEIWDDDTFSNDLITSTVTDASGNYSVTFSNDTGLFEGGYDIFTKIKCEGEGFRIKPLGKKAQVYSINSSQTNDVDDGTTITTDYTLNATDDSNKAFSIHQAMVMAGNYVKNVNGSVFPTIDFFYPDNSGGCFYRAGDGIHITDARTYVWDVIHHEFGHYVSDCLNIINNVGGNHAVGENLSDRLGKDDGIRLAWNEAWATYFGTSLQKQQNASRLGLADAGDTWYRNFYDLESQSGSTSGGEDDEVAVQRVLWDMDDSGNDNGDTLSLGYRSLWNSITSSNATTMSDAVQAVTRGMSLNNKSLVGCILTEHKMASEPTAPADGYKVENGKIPKFTWTANGNCLNFKNNSFNVEFYDSTFSRLIFRSPTLTTTEYTPTQSEWNMIKSGIDRTINWVVVANQTDAPATGPYMSKNFKIQKSSELDVVFLVDTTGSMWDDIENVKSSISTIVDTISSSVPDYRMAVADYKDFPVSPYGDPGDYTYRAVHAFTNDKAAIVSSVNSLYASGGNDWPESVYSGLINTINGNGIGEWRKDADKVIIVMGDAPPHDPEPFTGYTLASVVNAANAAGIVPPTPLPSLTAESSEMGKMDSVSMEPGMPLAPSTTAVESESKGIRIYSIVIGGDYYAKTYFEGLSSGTGGKVFTAAVASDVSSAILDAIGSISGDDPEPPENSAPDVTGATASISNLWPVNHKMIPVKIMNVVDPDGDTFEIKITSVTQDEPVKGDKDLAADADGIGTDTVYLRATRMGNGNARVYLIKFTATDSKGAVSEGSVRVCVPHDNGKNTVIVDDGQIYDSTKK